MAHTVVWPNVKAFYAIGNTPAVCFTNALPPEEPADILLLGCGDGRNILYTIYADLGPPSRTLDFTCCDIDPAILARNILLYTLLAEFPLENGDEDLQKIWNFYYHFFIDKGTLDMVLKQCQVLVDLSPDIATWNGGKYGSFLRFSSTHSLSTIRKHWELYIGTKSLSKDDLDLLRAGFRKGTILKGGDGAGRSAGPLWLELPKDIGPKAYRHYWETGLTFDEPDKVADANEINPTFAYSAMKKGFALPYGCEPILSFHLAKTLAQTSGSQLDESGTISGFFKGAFEEFKSWCRAFNKRIKRRASLVIRFLVGDAIALCRALHYCATNCSIDPGLYAGPWTSTLLRLDGGDYAESASGRAPLLFNIIDTSNLTDDIGLLNILVPCRPLMQTKPSSIILTSTLFSDDDGVAQDCFLDLLCGDLSTLSIILDLIPISYASNFTSHCNVHEMRLLASNASEKQFHKPIAWRIGTLSDSAAIGEKAQSDLDLRFDEKQLATFLHGIYKKMFSHEDMTTLFEPKGMSSRSLRRFAMIHYCRFTFAYILRFVKDRVNVDWEDLIDHLRELVASDKTLMSSGDAYHLSCGVHLLGIHGSPRLLPNYNANVNGPLKGWKNVPPVVCITLQVPRKCLNILTKYTAKQIGTPVLVCALIGTAVRSHHSFAHFQCFWGEIKATYSEDSSQEPTITFDEDPEGFQGSSTAIFTFYVPVSILGVGGQQKVLLQVQPNLGVADVLFPVLGEWLIMFSAELTDQKHVHITRERPGNPGELQKLRNISSTRHIAEETRPSRYPVKITLDSAARQVALLTGRTKIVDRRAKAALANKAAVSVKQISPRVMQISIGGHLQNIVFPFPVDSTDFKTRISKKQSYIELDVKISGPEEKLGMSLKPFPVIEQDATLSLWNIHYIDLERLPALDLSSPERLSFLWLHVRTSYSHRERQLCAAKKEGTLTEDLDVITGVKQCIQDLITICSGLVGERCYVVGLSDPENFGDYTLIFINGVRLDLASHTVVVDACVLPLTGKVMSELGNAIKRVGEGTGFMRTVTKPDEVRAWKHLLPAVTERCRKWSHTANCEYLSKGVPVSEEITESPLCSCGQGKNLGSFTERENWKELAPYVTRAAISPLFAMPFSNTIGSDILNACRGSFGKVRVTVCSNCDSPGKPKLLTCGRCGYVKYCSTICQKIDWKVHKEVCKKV